MAIITTLNAIRKHGPCREGWAKLLRHLGKTKADDEPLPFSVILESNGLDDALWCCRTATQYSREWRLFACDCAEHVLHLYEREHPDNKRPRNAIEVARRYANGEATETELQAARAAAYAAYAASATAAAAADAASATADAAAYAAAYATADAARSVEREWQMQRFLEYVK